MVRFAVVGFIFIFTLVQTGISPAQTTIDKDKLLKKLGEAVLGEEKRTAILDVDSEPQGAAVYVDNVLRGKTPCSLDDISPGIRTIQVELQGYSTQRKALEVQAGETQMLKFLLVAAGVPPATNAALSADKASPSVQGTTVTFKAAGEGGIGKYEYRFFVKGPSTGDKWVEAQEFSTTDTWVWETKPSDVGSNQILVHARSEGSTSEKEAESILSFEISSAPKVQAEPAQLSRLFVDTDPLDAQVRILNIGPAYKRGMGLQEGWYHVEVAREGYETVQQWVKIEPGKDKVLRIGLAREVAAPKPPPPGTLDVDSEPRGAWVYANNALIGRTPFTHSGITPGEVAVRVTMEGYVAQEKSIEVAPGGRHALNFRLARVVAEQPKVEAKPQGRLFVNADPAGARIRILNIGPRYQRGMSLDEGLYHVEVSQPGFETITKWVELRAGEDEQIWIALERERAPAPKPTPAVRPAAPAVGAPVPSEGFKTWVYTRLPDVPEGLCVDSRNNLYASMPFTGEVVLLRDDGYYEHIAWVPSRAESGQGEVLGMDVDRYDNIYVAYVQFSEYMDVATDLFNKHHPACHDVRVTRSGVYKIDARTGGVTPVATRADGWPFCFPDDVAVDRAGNIYLTDLTYAAIWKISPDGSQVTLWSDDPLLNPTDPVSTMGVNVCVLDKEEKNLYAATTTVTGRIVKIPIEADGSAGKAELFSTAHSAFDGIEIDEEGYIYASEPVLNQIIVLPPKAGPWSLTPRKVIARGAPLQGPTSLVLRAGVLYTANLAFGIPKEYQDKTVVAIRGFSKN